MKIFVYIVVIFVFFIIILATTWGPNHALRKHAKEKTEAQIKLLVSAIEQYKSTFGHYPKNTSNSNYELDFAECLSDKQPNSSSGSTRLMYIDFRKMNFTLSNDDYDEGNAGSTKILDPYENPYLYFLNKEQNSYYVWSVGLDGEDNSLDKIKMNIKNKNLGDDIVGFKK